MGDDGPRDRESEVVLLARARAGDNAAWKEIIKSLRSYLLPQVKRSLKNEQEAAELVQDTIAVFFRELQSGRFRGEASYLSWATTVALRNAMRASTRRKFHQQVLEAHEGYLPGLGEPPLDPERSAAVSEHLEALHLSLPLLCKRDQELVMDPLDEDDAPENALPPASPATRTARSRARARLRALMEGRENR